MSKASVYEAKTESFIQPILDSMNFELVDVEYVKEGGMNYLRAYIDKDGGITVDDCEVVARQMNEILDREDYILIRTPSRSARRGLEDLSRRKRTMCAI